MYPASQALDLDNESDASRPQSLSLEIIQNGGVRTTQDFCDLMSALMSDTITGAVSGEMTNATCSAGRNLIKMFELQHKLSNNPARDRTPLPLAFLSRKLAAR